MNGAIKFTEWCDKKFTKHHAESISLAVHLYDLAQIKLVEDRASNAVFRCSAMIILRD